MLSCRVKDWIVFVRRNSSSDPHRDVVRDRISDELTSLIVWCVVAVVCVDALSLRLGIAVGTVCVHSTVYAVVALHWIRCI